MRRPDPAFWRGRRVLLTGHTGFKGGWAALMLARLGARVDGVALAPEATPNLFELARIADHVTSHLCDLGEREALGALVKAVDPEIVLHMAAQPLVRRSFRQPVETFATNVMGSIHLMEALRDAPSLRAALMVTTDKVYENPERGQPFSETDPLGGHDPYAASKAAMEIAVSSWRRSFFASRGVAVATARGGNVIGGGDFSEDRLIPDVVRAAAAGRAVRLRHPHSVRPWQHVLDCLSGYLLYLEALADPARRDKLPASLNIGPEGDELTVAEVAEAIGAALGSGWAWEQEPGDQPHEAKLLRLETSMARSVLGWRDLLPGRAALEATADWYRACAAGADMERITRNEVGRYLTG